jgi:hypothetical protein
MKQVTRAVYMCKGVYPNVSGLVQMVQLSATRCNCIGILWVSLVSFVSITLCVASQRVFIVVSVYFVIDSFRKLYVCVRVCVCVY